MFTNLNQVITLCHQYRDRPACMYVCSITRFYTGGWQTSNSHPDIPKNEHFQKLKVDYSI